MILFSQVPIGSLFMYDGRLYRRLSKNYKQASESNQLTETDLMTPIMPVDDVPFVLPDNTIEYFDLRGRPHRANGPAIESPNGYQAWYWHGKLHRKDGPALTEVCKTQIWYYRGKRHRVDGPAVIRYNGDTDWFCNGLYHRTNGPARDYRSTTGLEIWYNNGKLHRTDGPAIIRPDGSVEYWINDQAVTEYEFMFLSGANYD